MLELYHSGVTTCSKQVRHCLKEKGIAYETRFIQLWNYENLNPEYLKLNPNGVVPTLVHDGVAIIQSLAINEYIEDAFPEPPLRPADLKQRALMRYWTLTADEAHLASTQLSYVNMLQSKAEALSDEDKETMLAHTPVPDRRERWRRTVTGGYTDQEIQVSLDKISFVAMRMEEQLAKTDWLAADMFTLADISMLAIVQRVYELYPDHLMADKYPHVDDWRLRNLARPATAAAYSNQISDEFLGRPAEKSLSGLTSFAHI
jgi:glutathione S-transferase